MQILEGELMTIIILYYKVFKLSSFVVRYLIASSLSYGRPINGQREIAAVKNPGSFSSHWRVKEGVFIHKDEPSEFHSDLHHTEL